MSEHYILEGRTPVRAASLMEWARWMESHSDKRVIAFERIGPVTVSTVFLGLDHNFMGGAPVLFETLVFEGVLDGEMDRYFTIDEAERGHAAMAARVKEAL